MIENHLIESPFPSRPTLLIFEDANLQKIEPIFELTFENLLSFFRCSLEKNLEWVEGDW